MAERLIRWSFRLLAYLTIGVTLAIILVLLTDAFQFFREIPIQHFLFETRWEPFGEPKMLGVLPLLSGTLMVAFGSIAVALPLGLGSAIFLTQYAPRRVQEVALPVTEILGGIPTVVYGYFALTVVTPFLQKFFTGMETFNALSASIVVGIGILPMISSLSADALRVVPNVIRNGAYALGMRKFHVLTRVIIPAATSGIISSCILAFSRAIGETMAVTLAAGATPNLDFNFLKGIQTMTAFIVQVSLGDTPVSSLEYYTIYALGLLLFIITFLFNLIATWVVKKFREVYQ
jgi:phosphate transport system permease protein